MKHRISKRVLALVCAIAMALALVAVPAYATVLLAPGNIAAQASTSGTTSDGWAWKANEEGTAVTLVGYTGTSLAPSVPATVSGLPVTGAIVNKGAGAPAITSIDISAAASSLEQLKVWGCALTSLDVSACSNLTKLIVSQNQLTSLKLGTLPKLTWLQCSDNKLASLDIAGCTALTNLRCDGNEIAVLDLTKCTALEYVDCHENKLTDLRPGACLNLNDLFCYDNNIVDRVYDLTQRYGTESKVILPQQEPSGEGTPSEGESGEGTSTAQSIEDVVLSQYTYTYDGSVKTPSAMVKGADGKVLSSGTDYDLTYEGGRVNAGSYKVTVKGKGNYTGTFRTVFIISQASLSKLEISKSTYQYNGKAQTPDVTVKGPAGSTLARGVDYSVTYPSGCKNVGTYTVTVKGTGNYIGSLSADFSITLAKAALKSAKAGKRKITVQMGKNASAYGGTRFDIAYKVKGAKTWKYAKATSQSKDIKKLKKGKKYQVKVRVQMNISGTWHSGAWSATKTTKKVK